MAFLVSAIIQEAADLSNVLISDTSGNLTSSQALSVLQRSYETVAGSPYTFQDFQMVNLAPGQLRYSMPQNFQQMRRVVYSADQIYPSIVGATFTITLGVNDAMNVSVNGAAAINVTLSPGVYTPQTLATELQLKIPGTKANASPLVLDVTQTNTVMLYTKQDIDGSLLFNACANSAYATLGMTAQVGTTLSSNGFWEVFFIYDRSSLTFPIGSASVPTDYSIITYDSVASTATSELEIYPPPSSTAVTGSFLYYYTAYHQNYTTTDYMNYPDYMHTPLIYLMAAQFCEYDRNVQLALYMRGRYEEAMSKAREQIVANRSPEDRSWDPNLKGGPGDSIMGRIWTPYSPWVILLTALLSQIFT